MSFRARTTHPPSAGGRDVWTGIAPLEGGRMTSPARGRPSSPTPQIRELFVRFWRDFLGRYRGGFVRVGLLMVLSVVLQLPAPLLTMRIVDAAVGGATLELITRVSLLF